MKPPSTRNTGNNFSKPLEEKYQNLTFDFGVSDKNENKATLKAPNGKASNLSAEQHRLVRTPAFKAWFGDWEEAYSTGNYDGVSKVLDENGEPLVVYHGTKSNFTIFNMVDRIKEFDVRDYGAYFTNDKETAKVYSLDFSSPTEYSEEIEKKYQQALQKWLESKTQDDLEALRKLSEQRVQLSQNLLQSFHQKYVIECFLNIKTPYVFDAKGKLWSEVLVGKVDTALDNNNDGIIMKNMVEVNSIVQTTYIAFKPNQIKLADGTNTTFDSNNPDIRFDGGGEIEKMIEQGDIELNIYPTTPEHAAEYGLTAIKPLFVQNICVSDNKRLKGIGKEVLNYIDDYAIKNGHDIIFGHVARKAEFTQDDRETFFCDVDMIKHWLHGKGYAINDDNNDFHKVVKKPLPTETQNPVKGFCCWYKDWYKPISGKMNIMFSVPNELHLEEFLAMMTEENVVVMELFEKIDQNIDAKPFMRQICEKADELGITIYLEPNPRYKYFIENTEKRNKVSKEYLFAYYSNFGFEPTSDKRFMKRTPNMRFKKGGQINIDDYMLLTYHEKEGNWFVPKNEVYLWLYDDMDAGKKLQSGEYDYVLFPPPPPLRMAFKKNFVPPLLQIWTKKYQKEHKGSEKLMAVIRAWYDEKNHKLYLLMMTTRKDLQRKGIISSMIKELRKKFNVEQEDVIFDDPTEQGKSVLESKKFDKGGIANDKLYVVKSKFISDSTAGFSKGYGNYQGIMLRIKDHIANWDNFYDYNLSWLENGEKPYLLSIVINDEYNEPLWYKYSQESENRLEDFISEHQDEYPDLKAKEFVFGADSNIDDIIWTIEHEVNKMNGSKKFKKGGEIDYKKLELERIAAKYKDFDFDLSPSPQKKVRLAPNGKPSKLNEVQYKAVRSANFINWFGDWQKAYKTGDYTNVSKCIDENGEPLIVYRGHSKKEAYQYTKVFNYQVNRFSQNRNPNRFAFYFTESYYVANQYGGGDDEGIVTPYFLNIREMCDFTPSNPEYPNETEFYLPYADKYDKIWIESLVKIKEGKVTFANYKDELPEAVVSFFEKMQGRVTEKNFEGFKNLIEKKANYKMQEIVDENERYYGSNATLKQVIKMIDPNMPLSIMDKNDTHYTNFLEDYFNKNFPVFFFFIHHISFLYWNLPENTDIILKNEMVKRGFTGGKFLERTYAYNSPTGTEMVYFNFYSEDVKLADGSNYTFRPDVKDTDFGDGGMIMIYPD